jgi:hypothetical protein
MLNMMMVYMHRLPVSSANVFGFIIDANGNSAAAVNLQGGSRTVLAPIADPVPPGQSTVRTPTCPPCSRPSVLVLQSS